MIIIGERSQYIFYERRQQYTAKLSYQILVCRFGSESDRRSKAAGKIQEMFRKKREMEADKRRQLPQPRMLMKFEGHRNCRTMVGLVCFVGLFFFN